MITEWIKSVFSTLNIDLPTKFGFFGATISLESLLLLIFIIMYIFFGIEIYIGIKHFFNRRIN